MADQLDPSPRQAPDPLQPSARRKQLLPIGAACLAVPLIVGAILVATSVGDRGDTPEAVDEPAPPGMRYDYFRDVRVTVPASWDYRPEPGSDWCADGYDLPERPYVSLGGNGAVADIGCPPTGSDTKEFSDEPPIERWAPHLTLKGHADGFEEGAVQVGDWWVLRSRVSDVDVKAVNKEKDVAERWLASAVVVDRTAGGCLPHGAVQDGYFPRPSPAFDIASISDVDSITVCYYSSLGDDTAVGLESTAVIEGGEADQIVGAIQAAPTGRGPDRSESCSDEDRGQTAYQLLLRSGEETHTTYVYFSACHGNGFDDGTTPRTLTTDACSPLMEPPVQVWGGASASATKCMGIYY